MGWVCCADSHISALLDCHQSIFCGKCAVCCCINPEVKLVYIIVNNYLISGYMPPIAGIVNYYSLTCFGCISGVSSCYYSSLGYIYCSYHCQFLPGVYSPDADV